MALQIDTDIDYQRRAWKVQRIGWLIIGTLVIAALLGTFGTGPLSSVATDGTRLRLDYERFPRLGQSTRLRVSLQSAPELRLDFSRSYLEAFRIEQVTPEPRAVDATQDWLSYAFSGEGPITVTLDLVPEKFGGVRGATRGYGETVLFRQFVYP